MIAEFDLCSLVTDCQTSSEAEEVRALFTCVDRGDILRVERLLAEFPALVDAKDDNGDTPLHQAARLGDAELAQTLLQNGADTEVRTPRGYTPLHLAVLGGREKVIARLIACGADATLLGLNAR